MSLRSPATSGILKTIVSHPVPVVTANRSPVLFLPSDPLANPSSNLRSTLWPAAGE